jgi:hypothetical protein
VARVNVRGLEIEQEIFIGRDATRLGTTAQMAFWKFVTDAHNPVLERLMVSSVANEDGFRFASSHRNGKSTIKT